MGDLERKEEVKYSHIGRSEERSGKEVKYPKIRRFGKG